MLDPLVQQQTFRYFGDDGDEANGTPLAFEGVNLAATLTGQAVFRLRFGLEELNASAARSQQYTLQARRDGGTWTDVTETSGATVGFQLVASAFETHAVQTSSRLVNYTNAPDFIAGFFVSQNPVGLTMTLQASAQTEWEYCTAIDPGPFPSGSFFEFRLVGDGLPLDNYAILAGFTLTKPTIIDFSGSTSAVAAASAAEPKRQRGFTGSTLAVASVSSPFTWVGVLRGAITALAFATGELGLTYRFSGSASATASASGALAKLKTLTGNALATAQASGNFVTAFYLVPTALVGVATATSNVFDRIRRYYGSAVATATAVGALTVVPLFSGSTFATAAASADLTIEKAKSGYLTLQLWGD